MKKLLACILCIGIFTAFVSGCHVAKPAPETTESSTLPIDPLFDQSYKEAFNAYSAVSGHPGDNPVYFFTYDGLLICGNSRPLHTAQMEPSAFDKEQFLSYCTDDEYWHEYFSPQYICDHVEKVWRGDNIAVDVGYSIGRNTFFILFLLDDGELLLCTVSDAKDESGNFTEQPILKTAEVLKPSGDINAFFSYWNNFYNPELGNDWLEECPESIARWEALQEKYCQ